MSVNVKLYSVLKQGRFEETEIEPGGGSTLRDLIAALDMKVEDVGVITVNGKVGSYKQKLNQGDQITILPFILGG